MKTIPNNLNEEPFNRIYQELLSLGISMNYVGFWFCAYTIFLVMKDPGTITNITKSVYIPVAKHFGVSEANVERNIRTIIDVVWNENASLLNNYAGYDLLYKPTCSQFISILSIYIINEQRD